MECIIDHVSKDLLRNHRHPQRRQEQMVADVPAVAIFAARKRLEMPTPAEGFDRLFAVTMNEEERRFEVTPWPAVWS
jgi:hypothetical protein